jgi:hypothetical protein
MTGTREGSPVSARALGSVRGCQAARSGGPPEQQARARFQGQATDLETHDPFLRAFAAIFGHADWVTMVCVP